MLDITVLPKTQERKVRDPAFAERLREACDLHPQVPPLHRGRLVWIKEALKSRKIEVSTETVRRWLEGEARPRPDKASLLAEILNVDVAWLTLGIDGQVSAKERRARNASADGAVNIVAGMVQMDGSYPAFPRDDDERARREHIDLYAIIRGVNYAIHVSCGTERPGAIDFVVPASRSSGVVMLGLVRRAMGFEVFELDDDTVQRYGVCRGGSTSVSLPGRDALRPIRSFAERL